jgi:hypothetical protein
MGRLAKRWLARTEAHPELTQSTGASDGRPELYQAQLATWQPVTREEASYLELIEVPTIPPPEESCLHLLDALGIAGR